MKDTLVLVRVLSFRGRDGMKGFRTKQLASRERPSGCLPDSGKMTWLMTMLRQSISNLASSCEGWGGVANMRCKMDDHREEREEKQPQREEGTQ